MTYCPDSKNDLTFKRTFGEYPHLSVSFLNALMLPAPGQDRREHQIAVARTGARKSPEEKLLLRRNFPT
jgi:hypothetical protein